MIWAIIRAAFPGKNLQLVSDFFLAFFFVNFFVTSFYRISRHERLESSLTTINETANKTESTVAVFVQQFQNAAKANPALQVFFQT